MNRILQHRRFCSLENIAVAALCLTALFSASNRMTDHTVVPRQLFTAFVLSISAIACSIKVLAGKGFKVDPLAWSVIISLSCTAEAIYALIQFCFIHILHLPLHVTGSFDNPVGLMSALCLGLPFCIYVVTQTTKYRKVFITFGLIMIAAILASQSRTGIVATALILLYYSLRHTKLSPIKSICITIAATFVLIAASYFVNSDSVTGRLLIWRACWPLIVDTPFCGYGAGAFLHLYMHAQADYLSAFSPDEPYAMLASNSIVPFNEYIELYLNFGIIGLTVLFLFVIILLFASRRVPDKSKQFALLSLFALAFISLFSYPFTYPFTYVIVFISFIIILKGFFVKPISKFSRVTVAAFVLCASTFYCYKVCDRINAEYQWNDAFLKRDLVAYSILKPRLEHIPHFLYNYACETYIQGEYNLSMLLAKECTYYLSNYNLELLLGDIYLELGDFIHAKKHYQLAEDMCPCRVTPLVGIFDIYLAEDEEEKALDLALFILNKPIKINSKKNEAIRIRMQNYIYNNDLK